VTLYDRLQTNKCQGKSFRKATKKAPAKVGAAGLGMDDLIMKTSVFYVLNEQFFKRIHFVPELVVFALHLIAECIGCPEDYANDDCWRQQS